MGIIRLSLGYLQVTSEHVKHLLISKKYFLILCEWFPVNLPFTIITMCH